jgi:hypothetical protein
MRGVVRARVSDLRDELLAPGEVLPEVSCFGV